MRTKQREFYTYVDIDRIIPKTSNTKEFIYKSGNVTVRLQYTFDLKYHLTLPKMKFLALYSKSSELSMQKFYVKVAQALNLEQGISFLEGYGDSSKSMCGPAVAFSFCSHLSLS